MNRTYLSFAVLLSTLLTITGCGGNSDSTASIRVLHASPDAPAVDILIDGSPLVEGVSYPTASGFSDIEAGHRRIQVNLAGSDTSVIDARADFAEDSRYLVVASGRAAEISPLIFPVTADRPVAGSALIRVLHAAASAPDVDVYAVEEATSIASVQPVLSGVPFRAISDYLSVPQGRYDLYVTIKGTKTVAIEARGVSIAEGAVLTVSALDAPGGGAPFSLQILDENI